MDRAGYLLARTISASGPANVNQLADMLGLDGSTITRQVAALEARGFAIRGVDPANARASIVALTPDGRREMRRVGAARTQRIAELVGGWPEHDVRNFAELLGRFNEAMSRPGEPAHAAPTFANDTECPSGT